MQISSEPPHVSRNRKSRCTMPWILSVPTYILPNMLRNRTNSPLYTLLLSTLKNGTRYLSSRTRTVYSTRASFHTSGLHFSFPRAFENSPTICSQHYLILHLRDRSSIQVGHAASIIYYIFRDYPTAAFILCIQFLVISLQCPAHRAVWGSCSPISHIQYRTRSPQHTL